MLCQLQQLTQWRGILVMHTVTRYSRHHRRRFPKVDGRVSHCSVDITVSARIMELVRTGRLRLSQFLCIPAIWLRLVNQHPLKIWAMTSAGGTITVCMVCCRMLALSHSEKSISTSHLLRLVLISKVGCFVFFCMNLNSIRDDIGAIIAIPTSITVYNWYTSSWR